jgi:hypothetical protein
MARKSNPVYYDVVCVICGKSATRTARNGTPKTCGNTECVNRHKKNLRVIQNELYRQSGKMKEWHKNNYEKTKALNPPKELKEKQRCKTDIDADISCLRAVINAEKKKAMAREGLFRCWRCKVVMSIKHKGAHKQPTCKPCQTKMTQEWAKRNPEKQKAAHKRTWNRIMNDPVKLIKARIRQRISKAIKLYGSGVYVEGGKLRYLGCTAAEAVTHIERQMNSRMTWDNYGSSWHIDHIQPCAAYDMTKEEDRRKAFHYTNLQPLWARANVRKGDRLMTKPHQPELILA